MKYLMVILSLGFATQTAHADGPLNKIFEDADRSAEAVIQVANDFPFLIDLVRGIKNGSLSSKDREAAARLGLDKPFIRILKKRKLSEKDKRYLLDRLHEIVLGWRGKTEQLVENLTAVRLAVCLDQLHGKTESEWLSGEDLKLWFKQEMRRCMDGEPDKKGGKQTPYLLRNKEKILNAEGFVKRLGSYANSLL